MKRTTFLSGGLLLAMVGAASADFTGLVIEEYVDPEASALGLTITRLYATFDSPDDEVLGVFGSEITTNATSGFWQPPPGQGDGSDTAPLQLVVDLFPIAAFDTFVTIGLAIDDGTDSTVNDTDFNLGFDEIRGGWLNGNPINPNGQMLPDADGRVLLAQMTVQDAVATDLIFGSLEVIWQADGAGEAFYTPAEFIQQVPGPGAAALMMLAALGHRRRRR